MLRVVPGALSLLAAAALAQAAHAQVIPFDYTLGTVRVTESADEIRLHTVPPVTVAILPGGRTWPRLLLDSEGRIHAGAIVVDAATGRMRRLGNDAALALPYGVIVAPVGNAFRITRGRRSCTVSQTTLGIDGETDAATTLRVRHIVFSPSARGLAVLTRRTDATTGDTDYQVLGIDIGACRVSRTALGDPDLLVELHHSPQGGWWLTGSIEQTLLRSRDGRTWQPVPLPDGLSSLISSYLVDDREIWLAGLLGSVADEEAQLIYSGDGGRTWRSLLWNDPLLARVPKGWLEGQKRAQVAAAAFSGAQPTPVPR